MMKSWLARVCVTVAMVASVLVVAPGHASAVGNVTIYPVSGLSGSQTQLTSGPDGALWFTNFSESSIGRITTSGTATVFPTSSQPYAIAEGPDGALWFTNPVGFQIGRITTSGSVAAYPPGGSLNIYSAQGIAAGPDGAMWFTNFVSGKIGRITMGGAITYFDVAGAATEIIAGPDGAMWFVYPSGTIGRIDMSGNVTYFTDPAILAPKGLTAGSDGKLWFFNDNNLEKPSVVAMTTAGDVVTNVDLSDDFVRSMTAGPDGALWFTKIAGGVEGVGRITTSGVVTNYDIAFPNGPAGSLSFGSDGLPWFISHFGIAKMELVFGVYTSSLPTGQVASPYAQTLVATDGVGPYSWTINSGSLPPGLTLSATGVVSGTPTTVGTFPFVVRVTDSDGPAATATRALSITIGPAPFRITTTSLPNATLGVPYVKTLAAADGIAPYKWKKLTKLPPGLKLNAKTGIISGTPKKLTGTYTVTIQARYKTTVPKPAAWHYASKTFTLVVT